MPWYFYHALKQLFPSGRFFSFFSAMSIVGVMLGVCVLIIVQTVMNGFGQNIRKQLTETQGDIRIRSNQIIYDWEELLDQMSIREEVKGAEPFAEGIVMVQHKDRPQFPFVRGIEPWSNPEVIPVQKFLTVVEGDRDSAMEAFDDEGVFLGEGLAYALQAQPGSLIEVFTPLMLEGLKNEEVLLPKEMRVLGLFRTGSPQVDQNTMITTLRAMQDLYGLNGGVHGTVLRLEDSVDALEFSKLLESEILSPELDAVSWLESNQDFLFVIEQEKRVISFIIIFIILVASFSIAIALMMAVIRKTREIGLLVAMGGRPYQIALSFCFQGMVIGFVGTVCGILMAVICLHFRREILSFYTKITRSQIEFLSQYDVYEIPIHYLRDDFILVSVFAIVTSTLAGLLPAFRAASLKPADALRSE